MRTVSSIAITTLSGDRYGGKWRRPDMADRPSLGVPSPDAVAAVQEFAAGLQAGHLIIAAPMRPGGAVSAK
jgi:hypothetical protein